MPTSNADLSAQITENGIHWKESTEGMSGTIIFEVGYNKLGYTLQGSPVGGLPKKGVSKFCDFLKYKPPGSDKMICRELSYDDPSGCEGDRDYEMVTVTAEFSTAGWLDGTAKESWKASLDIREVGGGRVWASDQAYVDQPITITIAVAEWGIDQVFSFNSSLLSHVMNYSGKVNSRRYRGSAPGTLLFQPPRVQKYYDHSWKQWFMSISAEIKWREIPWNYEYRTDVGRWDMTIPQLFREADFTGLPFVFG